MVGISPVVAADLVEGGWMGIDYPLAVKKDRVLVATIFGVTKLLEGRNIRSTH